MSDRILLINAVHPEECRVAIVEGFSLEGFFIETASLAKSIGNIYKGIVEQVQPSLQAAFVNYGADKKGFLPLDEIHPEYFIVEPKGEPRIQDLLVPGQEVLVQITKEAVGNKGAALTTYISLAGRYVVLMPGNPTRTMSRKIGDEREKERLKEILRSVELPEETGLIIRTAAAGQPKRDILKDLKYLLKIWRNIIERTKKTPAPALIYKERSLIIRVLRDYFDANIKKIIVDQKAFFYEVKDFLKIISPRHANIVEFYKNNSPLFSSYGIEKQIEQIFKKRVNLPSGGYIVIEPTEALVAIDVNSGKATLEDDIEETAYRVNLEAAVEIPKQLRLRDLGGLIVIDFIDMMNPVHKRKVELTLKQECRKDKAKVNLGRISKFGLLEISRQHIGLNVQSGSYRACPFCKGNGLIQTVEAASLALMRKIWNKIEVSGGIFETLKVRACPEIAFYLLNEKRKEIMGLENKYNVRIVVEGDITLRPHESYFEETKYSDSETK